MSGAEELTNSTKPDVSVVLPIYNAEPYLREALDSLVAQTHHNIEIICVNDGSTDTSLAIMQEYAANDPRIVIEDGPNGGYGRAMNRGINRARGEFVGILEPDDTLEPTMFEKLLPVARNNNLDFVRADFYRFTSDEENGAKRWVVPICHTDPTLYNKVLNPQNNLELFNVRMQNWTGIYRRSFLNEHEIRFHESPGARFQDNSFWFQTYLWATRVMYVPEPFYCHRDDNPNSSTNRTDLMFAMLDEWKWIREYLARFPEKEAKLITIYQYRKFHNCSFAFTKLANELQLPYLERFAQEFRDADAAGEIDYGMFSENDRKRLQAIMDDPAAWLDEYRNKRAKGKDIDSVQKKGRVALFLYHLHNGGLIHALKTSARHIARAIARRLSR